MYAVPRGAWRTSRKHPGRTFGIPGHNEKTNLITYTRRKVMKNVAASFCIDDRCDYYRRAETIFNELDEPVLDTLNEHFLAKHIML